MANEEQYQDIRSLVLSGGVKPKAQAVYVDRLGGWLNIRELYGDERARVLQDAVAQKTGAVNLGVLYAGLVVQSLRYPHPDVPPVAPTPPDPLQGNPSPEDQGKYDQAEVKYLQAVEDYKHPYPTDHPRAGEKVFQPTDRDAMNQALPGQVIEQIAQPAFSLSGLKKEDVEEKKASLNRTTVDGTITGSQIISEDPTSPDSSVS